MAEAQAKQDKASGVLPALRGSRQALRCPLTQQHRHPERKPAAGVSCLLSCRRRCRRRSLPPRLEQIRTPHLLTALPVCIALQEPVQLLETSRLWGVCCVTACLFMPRGVLPPPTCTTDSFALCLPPLGRIDSCLLCSMLQGPLVLRFRPSPTAESAEMHRKQRGDPEPMSPGKSGLGRHVGACCQGQCSTPLCVCGMLGAVQMEEQHA